VGKSSLLNAFTGRRRIARTSQTPGKTCAVNVYDVDDRFYLVDLPGYGYARHSRATRAQLLRLIADYLSDRTTLAGVVWLLDIRLLALTKADKMPYGRRVERRRALLRQLGAPEEQAILTSAQSRIGVTELRAAVDAFLARRHA
jgi:GTP-binding protein